MQLRDDYHEDSFSSAEDALAWLDKRQMRVREFAAGEIRLGEKGALVGGESMEIGQGAFKDLLRLLRVPEDFAVEVCDDELLTTVVNHLAERSRESAHVVSEENFVRHILPGQSAPIDHRLVLEQMAGAPTEGVSVTVTPEIMRVTFVTGIPQKLVNGEEVAFGYEVVNWATCGRLTVSPYVLVQICRNGAISRRPLANFRYGSEKNKPLSRILYDFRNTISACHDFAGVVEGLNASVGEILGQAAVIAEKFLIRVFGEMVYETSLKGSLGEQSSVFNLVNVITRAAKAERLQNRREHEACAGDILEVLSRGERRREKLVRFLACRKCPLMN